MKTVYPPTNTVCGGGIINNFYIQSLTEIIATPNPLKHPDLHVVVFSIYHFVLKFILVGNKVNPGLMLNSITFNLLLQCAYNKYGL